MWAALLVPLSSSWLALAGEAAIYAPPAAQSVSPAPAATEDDAVIVIQAYDGGLSAVHANSTDVELSVARDATLRDEAVLSVEYPAASGNPAARDVWCDAATQDWTVGRAISFQVKPDHPIKLSLSFLDRNRVAYTSWTELRGGEWQTVRVSFDEIRPNPYFQPPGAKTGEAIDVSEVKRVGFAPQDPGAGRLAISRFVLLD